MNRKSSFVATRCVFLGSKWPTNAFVALGELTALSQPLSKLRGPTSKGRGREVEGGGCLTS